MITVKNYLKRPSTMEGSFHQVQKSLKLYSIITFYSGSTTAWRPTTRATTTSVRAVTAALLTVTGTCGGGREDRHTCDLRLCT
jgi:hypothetical protein